MLPKGFNLNHIDPGIRNLVITLNRIPEVNKKTTNYGPTSCEGHVYPKLKVMPVKNGWLYFYKPMSRKRGLMRTMEQFCSERPFFKLELRHFMSEGDFSMVGLNPAPYGKFGFYEVIAGFEPYEDRAKEIYFDGKTEEEQKEYYEKAELRKLEILKGWNTLDSRLLDYIFENITRDISSLPYMSEEESEIIAVCPHGHR